MNAWMKTGRMMARVSLALLAAVLPAGAQQLQLPDLSKLTPLAADVVDVSVDQALLGLASSFMGGEDGDKEVQALIGGLKGIYVKSFQFDRDGVVDAGVLEQVRSQLNSGHWSRLVTARSSKDRSDVGVYLWRQNGKAGGLAVLSSGPRELTIVNIVGTIDLEQLRKLQGKFGVPADLGIQKD
jgi:hypothetical protein